MNLDLTANAGSAAERVCVCVFHQHRSDGREFQMFVSRLPATGEMTFQGFKPTTSVLQRGASVPEDEPES